MWHLVDQGVVAPLAEWLETLNPGLPRDPDPNSSIDGSWFLSPRQHVVEYIIANAVLITVLVRSTVYCMQPGSPARKTLLRLRPRQTFQKMELFLILLTSLSVALRAYYLNTKGNLLFLLQPCHFFATLLSLLPFLPNDSHYVHVCFNFICYCLWGAVLAILTPDLRDYSQILEIENFWVEHILVLALPLYYIYTGKFLIFPFNLPFSLAAWGFIGVYHSLILNTAALWFGKNLNYLLAPPPGPLDILVNLGLGFLYRPFMFLNCLIMTCIFGFLYVHLLGRSIWDKKVITSSPISSPTAYFFSSRPMDALNIQGLKNTETVSGHLNTQGAIKAEQASGGPDWEGDGARVMAPETNTARFRASKSVKSQA